MSMMLISETEKTFDRAKAFYTARQFGYLPVKRKEAVCNIQLLRIVRTKGQNGRDRTGVLEVDIDEVGAVNPHLTIATSKIEVHL